MTTLICSGSLYSDWQNIRKTYVPNSSPQHSVFAEISSLAGDICQQQFQNSDELSWKPFRPENRYQYKASQLFSSIESEPLLAWDDNNSCLYLDFWKTVSENTRFVLFYSSPEFELSNYINTHSFDLVRVEKVIKAWFVRTKAMLTFFMNNRDRCLLVNVQSNGFADGLFTKLTNEKFDLELESNAFVTTPRSRQSALTEYLATTLLLNHHRVSELYDEVRSTATLIGSEDEPITSIDNRSESLISAFLTEVTAFQQLLITQSELHDQLSLSQLQVDQMAEELEYYFKNSAEQEKAATSMADYLSNDPLLKIAHRVRQAT